jgi:hypothetical protein
MGKLKKQEADAPLPGCSRIFAVAEVAAFKLLPAAKNRSINRYLSIDEEFPSKSGKHACKTPKDHLWTGTVKSPGLIKLWNVNASAGTIECMECLQLQQKDHP